jgi:outer membrane protein, heavy metal efflux system
MRYRFWFLIAAAGLSARAQSLDSLVEEALRSNREILAAQKKYEAARQRPSIAGALPDPMLSLGYSASGGPWPGSGLGKEPMANAGLMVSQEMPFPGKRKLREEIAGKEADAEFQQYLAVRLSVVGRLKMAWHEMHHAIVGEDVVRRYQEILRNFLRVAEARYSVGRAAQQDIFKAQTQFAIFETQLLRWRQERAARQAQINGLLNRPPATPIRVPLEIEPGELRVTEEQLLDYARTHAPMIAKEQKMIERGELSANLARKEYYPDYTVAGGYFNQGSMPPMWQFRVDFKLPGSFWRKQRSLVNEQTFMASEARHNYESASVTLRSRINEEYTLAATARKLMDLYARAVIPQAKLALESSVASYETGSLDFTALFMNFQTVVEYELMYHEEMMRFHLALARLEEMTGMEIKP